MNTQPEALRLADAMLAEPRKPTWDELDKAAAELRRLHEVNQELLKALESMLASIHPYREDGTPTIPDATINLVNAAINKATGEQA